MKKLKEIINKEQLEKANRGITLIALVITIIVLLILAAISIAALTGENGILTKAIESSEKNKKATAKEKVQLEVAGSFDDNGKLDINELKKNLKNNLNIQENEITDNVDGGITIPVDGCKVTIQPTGEVIEDEGVAKVEGTSEIWELNEKGDTIIGYKGTEISEETLIIPNFVEGKKIIGIGEGVPIFISNANLVEGKKLKISSGIEKIGNNAFYHLGFTGDLIIPNSITKIGSTAFVECKNFSGNLIVPSSVVEIGYNAFYGCTGLKGTLTVGMKDIPDKIFDNLNISEIIFEDTVESIGTETFYGCSELKGDLVIPGHVKKIGNRAFSACGFQGSIIILEGVKEIGNYAFESCSHAIGDLIIPSSVTVLGEGAFSACPFEGTLKIGIRNIDKRIGNGNFKELILDETVETIGDFAFAGNIIKGTLTIPKSVTNIGAYAFANQSELTGELIIPSNVTNIGEYAFVDCEKFTAISIQNAQEDITIGDNAFLGCSVKPQYKSI